MLAGGAAVFEWRHLRGHALRTPEAARGPVTFNRDIAPIIYAQCSHCHHAGGSGPFALLTFEDVHKRAAQVAKMTGQRLMPPWLPDRECGPFVEEARLSDAQIAMIQRWAASGAPAGDAAAAPAMPRYGSGWALGEPDVVLTAPDSYVLQPGGRDVYRNFVLPLSLESGRFVRAVELRPGNARVVHHAFLLLDPGGTARKRAGAQAGFSYGGMDPGGEVAGVDGQLLSWQPGKLPCIVTEDEPWRLGAGADIVLQMHMRPTGKTEPVRPSLGIYFTDKRPIRRTLRLMLRSTAIDIPPGSADYTISSSYELPVDAEAVVVNAHAHYLGKDLQGYAMLPDGSRRMLLRIPNWDFDWQGTYTFVEPVRLPRGTKLEMRYTYDNSSANPRNPSSPPRRVLYGPNSDDEMGEFWMLLRVRSASDYDVLATDYKHRYVFPDTISRLENLLARTGDSADLRAQLAGALLVAGRPAEAARQAQAAIAIQSDCAKAHRCLGVIFLAQGDFARAADEFRLAVKGDPGDYASQADLGLALGSKGSLAEGGEALRASLQINPLDPLTHTNLARVLALQGKIDEARAELARALKLDPEQSLALETLRMLGPAPGAKP